MASSNIDITGDPYYDRFDSSSNRTQVLFHSDRMLGTGELNEAQSILRYAIKGVGDSVMKDGDKQSGMGYVQNENMITVLEGEVYLAGQRRHFSQQNVQLTGTGVETVGVKISQQIVTAEDDSDLRNPSVGTDAAQSVGADRLEENVTLVANDPSSATIYTFKDGILINNNTDTELSRVSDLIATTSYETNGSFRSGSTGFELYTEQNADDDNKLDLIIEPGVAYVMGYPVRKKFATRIAIDKSLTTQKDQAEPSYYKKGTTKYNLGNAAVKSVSSVVAQVDKTVTITRGAVTAGTDAFADNNVAKVEKVFTEGANAVTYTEGTDYKYDHNGITWIAAGNYPTAGTSYRCQYVYNKVLQANTDYVVDLGKGDLPIATIDFTGKGIVGSGDSTGGTLIPDSLIQVNYEHYLYRKDLVTIDKSGNIVVHTGQPDNKATVAAPSLIDPTTLQIGYVEILPNSATSNPNVYVTTNVTMEELGKFRQRIANLEYNQAINMLDEDAYKAADPTSLRGVFSDGFISFDKADVNNQDYNAAMSFDDAELTLPWTAQDDVTPDLDLDQSSMDTTGNIISAPFTEQIVIQQTMISGSVNVNKYDQVREGKLTLTPASDNWIDTENVTVTQDKTKTIYLDRWWWHGGWINSDDATWYVKNAQWNTDGASGVSQSVSGSWENFKTGANGNLQDLKGTVLEAGGTQTTDTMQEYIRTRTLTFAASGLTPNSNGYYITFNGIRCPIKAGSGYNAANKDGKVQVSAHGDYQGTFDIPANVKCGTREVIFTNDTDSCEAPYEAQGITRTVEDIIYKTYVTAHFTDPLAQSFVPTMAYNMTSVGIYFASKSSTEQVKVQIRNMEAGFPSTTVYGEVILDPADVQVSSDGSKETKVTFDDMIRLDSGTQYAIVLVSGSDDYTLYYADSTQYLLGTSTLIGQNPYVAGVMFTSSNAYTWTAEQTSDLKFNIYAAQYNATATIQFKPMDVKLDSLVLLSTYLTPDETGCTWYYRALYSTTAGNTDITTLPWLPLANYELVEANGLVTKLQLKATFDSSMYSSPLLSMEDLSLGAFLRGLTGSYLTLNVDTSDAPYNTLNVSYSQFTPATSTVTPKYSTDAGSTWKTFATNPVTTSDGDWLKVKYTQAVATGTNQDNWAKNFKLRLDLKTANSFERPRVKALQCIFNQE